jgi:anti-sigma factor RsiW
MAKVLYISELWILHMHTGISKRVSLRSKTSDLASDGVPVHSLSLLYKIDIAIFVLLSPKRVTCRF